MDEGKSHLHSVRTFFEPLLATTEFPTGKAGNYVLTIPAL